MAACRAMLIERILADPARGPDWFLAQALKAYINTRDRLLDHYTPPSP
jgi:hypothetical protein